jgi:hypothetical protein
MPRRDAQRRRTTIKEEIETYPGGDMVRRIGPVGSEKLLRHRVGLAAKDGDLMASSGWLQIEGERHI